jgi:hypothetical protein
VTYQDYIDLGFKRTDWNDPVNKTNYGYGGFYLEKRVSKRVSVCVEWNELATPKLILGTDEKCTRVPITCKDVQAIFAKEETWTNYA